MSMVFESKRIPLIKRINLVYVFWVIVLVAYSSNNVIGSAVLLVASFPFILFRLYKGTYNRMFFWTLAILVVFSIVYGLICYYYGLLTPIGLSRQLYYPFALFMLGNLLVQKDDSYNKTYTFLFSIIFGSALYGTLSMLNAIYRFGIPGEYRISVDIWNGAKLASTGMNSYISLGLCLLPVIFLSAKKVKNSKWKAISLIVFIASAYTTIQLGNRTGIIIVIASIIFVALLSRKTKSYVRNALMTVFVLGVGTVTYYADAFGIKTSWENSIVYSRFLASSLGEDPRIEAWGIAISGLYDNPMGGRITEFRVNYAHNLWLDVGVDGGIISIVLLGIFTITSLIILFQFLMIKYPPALKALVISIHAGFFITFSLEPVMQGLMDYFTFYCFVVGVLLRLNTDKVNNLASK